MCVDLALDQAERRRHRRRLGLGAPPSSWGAGAGRAARQHRGERVEVAGRRRHLLHDEGDRLAGGLGGVFFQTRALVAPQPGPSWRRAAGRWRRRACERHVAAEHERAAVGLQLFHGVVDGGADAVLAHDLLQRRGQRHRHGPP